MSYLLCVRLKKTFFQIFYFFFESVWCNTHFSPAFGKKWWNKYEERKQKLPKAFFFTCIRSWKVQTQYYLWQMVIHFGFVFDIELMHFFTLLMDFRYIWSIQGLRNVLVVTNHCGIYYNRVYLFSEMDPGIPPDNTLTHCGIALYSCQRTMITWLIPFWYLIILLIWLPRSKL